MSRLQKLRLLGETNITKLFDYWEFNIDLDKIVLETDAPYMSPTPFRGKRCTSDLIKYTAEKIAEIKGISVYEVLETTKETAIKLFKI